MMCDELVDLFELYALDVLDPDERASVHAHLADCKRCEQSLRKAIALNAMVLSTAPAVEPPRELRRRIVNLVAPAPPGRRTAPVWIGLAAGLACLAVWLGISRQRFETEARETRAALQSEQAERQQINAAFAFLRDPETRPASARPEANQPRGTYFVNPKSGVLLIASNLPQLDAAKKYEMWVIPKGQPPKPAGLFRPGPEGAAVHLEQGPVDVSAMAALAITVEPAAGSSAPTTQPMLVTPVGGS